MVAERGDLDSFVTCRDGCGTEGAHPRCPGPNAAPGPTGPGAGAVVPLPLVPGAESDSAPEPEPELGVALLSALEPDTTEELVLGVGAAGVVESVGALCLTAWVDPGVARDVAFVTRSERLPE